LPGVALGTVLQRQRRDPTTAQRNALGTKDKNSPSPERAFQSIQEEYRVFLERHGVAYDEKYVWD
jgi:hypothetical protein